MRLAQPERRANVQRAADAREEEFGGSVDRIEGEGSEAQVSFSVLDEGPGLTEAECAVATRRFWRASHASPGSGLGLAIASGIATHYGGRLALAPRTPRGLCASIELPAAAPEASAAESGSGV